MLAIDCPPPGVIRAGAEGFLGVDVKAPCPLLVVEDDPDIRESLGDVLAELGGFAVSLAANGVEALAHLDSALAPPHVILLDLMMPVMDGWTFLEVLEARKLLGTIAVVVASGSTGQRVPLAAGVVRKPFDLEALVAALRRGCTRCER